MSESRITQIARMTRVFGGYRWLVGICLNQDLWDYRIFRIDGTDAALEQEAYRLLERFMTSTFPTPVFPNQRPQFVN
ncbi:MAG: hypothetical protein OXU36_12095 [Candidatus Poribacteria bacterium]|nr:hypothetical protein [Candidatus Poribacteria bacterium]